MIAFCERPGDWLVNNLESTFFPGRTSILVWPTSPANFAEPHENGDAFHLAARRAYWLEARSTEDKEVMKRAMEKVG
jgi:hypothetical protein